MADELLRKILGIYKVNCEIISNIKSKEKVVFYDYKLRKIEKEGNVRFEVLENIAEIPVQQKIKDWEPTLKNKTPLLSIKDLFNDKIIYSCGNFEEIINLNSRMHDVAEKYEMFGESNKAKEELQKFKNNFEIIQTYLGSIEEILVEPKSLLLQNVEEIEKVNSILHKYVIKKDIPSFQRWVVTNGTSTGKLISGTSDGCWAYMEPKLPLNASYSIILNLKSSSNWFKLSLHPSPVDNNVGSASNSGCEICSYTVNWKNGHIVLNINNKQVSVTCNGTIMKSSDGITNLDKLLVNSDMLYLLVSAYYRGNMLELVDII